MKVALVQMCSTPDLAANSAKIHRFLDEAVAGGSELVLFPENCFYIGPLALLGDAARALEESWLPALRRRVASTSGTWVLLGSVPTWEEGRLHNRQQVLDERGRTVAAYDKIHLFALPGSASSLDERRMITPGAEPRCFERGGIRWGQTICYDLRFPELYRGLVELGCTGFVVPSAFTRFTGSKHWEVLLRARAIENQVYVLAPNQVGAHFGQLCSYGFSAVVDPDGGVVHLGTEEEGVLCAEVRPERVTEVRASLPVLQHRVLRS